MARSSLGTDAERDALASLAIHREPEKHATPHDKDRRARQMGIVWPSVEWKQAIQEQAQEWGLRPSDFIVLAVSQFMAGIDSGEITAPTTRPDPGQRAAQSLDLPWEPLEDKYGA